MIMEKLNPLTEWIIKRIDEIRLYTFDSVYPSVATMQATIAKKVIIAKTNNIFLVTFRCN